jgi:hypothetical protein
MIDRLPPQMRAKIQLELCPFPDLPGFCWGWTGAVTSSGYGSIGRNGRTISTHRLAYELIVGPIPDELTIDHLCLNELCANPAHMEPVTRRENTLRAQPERSRCAQGHALAGPNLVIRVRRGTQTHRTCRVCQYEWQRQRRHRIGESKRTRSVVQKRAQILGAAERALAEVAA